MTVKSPVTGLEYESDKMVYLMNPIQLARYLKHGCKLYDIFENTGRLVGVFSKDETKYYYDLWCKRELL